MLLRRDLLTNSSLDRIGTEVVGHVLVNSTKLEPSILCKCVKLKCLESLQSTALHTKKCVPCVCMVLTSEHILQPLILNQMAATYLQTVTGTGCVFCKLCHFYFYLSLFVCMLLNSYEAICGSLLAVTKGQSGW